MNLTYDVTVKISNSLEIYPHPLAIYLDTHSTDGCISCCRFIALIEQQRSEQMFWFWIFQGLDYRAVLKKQPPNDGYHVWLNPKEGYKVGTLDTEAGRLAILGNFHPQDIEVVFVRKVLHDDSNCACQNMSQVAPIILQVVGFEQKRASFLSPIHSLASKIYYALASKCNQ